MWTSSQGGIARDSQGKNATICASSGDLVPGFSQQLSTCHVFLFQKWGVRNIEIFRSTFLEEAFYSILNFKESTVNLIRYNALQTFNDTRWQSKTWPLGQKERAKMTDDHLASTSQNSFGPQALQDSRLETLQYHKLWWMYHKCVSYIMSIW